MKSWLLIGMMIVCSLVCGQEKLTISGTITSQASGEALIGASVKVRLGNELTGTVSDMNGFYSLTLPEGQHVVEYCFVGHASRRDTILLSENKVINVALKESALLNEVVVTSKSASDHITTTDMSKDVLSITQIKKMPALMGEVDIIKAIQLLPGVQSVGEGGSGFYVRGGAVDQNLILLDDANVYNASHLIGFFSVFNPDVVKDVQLYKGGIPAEYGGRISSVLDVRTAEGDFKKYTVNGGIGTISSRLTVGGPIVKDRSSFLVSGRRTYADMFLKLAPQEELRNNTLYFYDLNASVNYKINDNNKIYLSGYYGRDAFGIDSTISMNWGNAAATVRWNHAYNSRLVSNTTATFSNYDYFLGEPTGKDAYEWTSKIRDYYLKEDFTWFINDNHSLKFGGLTAFHQIDPGMAVGTGNSVLKMFKISKTNGLEYAAYVSHKYKISRRLNATYGLRFSAFQNVGPATYYTYDENYKITDTLSHRSGKIYNTYWGLEPRMALSILLNEFSSIKLSYNRTRQYIQLASNSTASSPLDIWFPCSPNVKPQIADQVAMGYFVNLKKEIYQASVEVYYKDMQNAIDFKDHANLMLNPYIEGELRFGRAWAYGSEFMVKKARGRLSGWISYTLSRAQKQIRGINNGNPYLAKSDQTHNLCVTMSYEITARFSVSTNFVYSTGAAVTMPVGKYEYYGKTIPIYSERNGSRLPDYHRWDIAATLEGKAKPNRKWHSEWVFSIYNVYNRANAYTITFKKSEIDPGQTVAEMMYLFGIIPSVTYNFKF